MEFQFDYDDEDGHVYLDIYGDGGRPIVLLELTTDQFITLRESVLAFDAELLQPVV